MGRPFQQSRFQVSSDQTLKNRPSFLGKMGIVSPTPMDHSPISQSFEFGKSISTAGKSILNFVQLSSLAAKYCKMWKNMAP